jgi:type IV secretory pathway VirB10-like protein
MRSGPTRLVAGSSWGRSTASGSWNRSASCPTTCRRRTGCQAPRPERARLPSPGAPTPRAAAPALSPGSAAASAAGATGGETSTASRRLEQIREKLRNPQNPTRRLAIFGVVVFVVLLFGNWIASVFFRSPSKAGVEVVETEAQRRARTEVEMKQAGPAQPVSPVLAQPQAPVEAALLVGATARSGPAAQAARSPSGLSLGSAEPTAMGSDPASARSRHRLQRTSPLEDPEPRFRRRTFGTSTRTSFVDAPSASRSAAAGQGAARLALPPGILIPARLIVPADPNAPGPVSAEVTRDVSAAGAIVVPRGSTILCSSQSLNGAQRVPLTCNALVIGGAAKTFSGTALGDDKRPGLPTTVTGGGSSTRDSARTGALDTAEGVASELVGGADGIAAALSRGAIRTGGGTARSATAPGSATADAVPAGKAIFVFVQQSGGLL